MLLLDSTDRSQRRGSAVLETLVAITLLSVVLGLAATLGATMLKQRKHIQQHRVALEAKVNLMTFAMATPYERLSETHLRSFAEQLTADDKATWEIRVEDVDAAKKIFADVTYGAKQPADAQKPLVCWRYDINRNLASETQP